MVSKFGGGVGGIRADSDAASTNHSKPQDGPENLPTSTTLPKSSHEAHQANVAQHVDPGQLEVSVHCYMQPGTLDHLPEVRAP